MGFAVLSTHPCNHFKKNPVSGLLREYEVRTGATIANQFEGFRLRFGAGQPLVLAVLDCKYIQRRDHDITLQKVAMRSRRKFSRCELLCTSPKEPSRNTAMLAKAGRKRVWK